MSSVTKPNGELVAADLTSTEDPDGGLVDTPGATNFVSDGASLEVKDNADVHINKALKSLVGKEELVMVKGSYKLAKKEVKPKKKPAVKKAAVKKAKPAKKAAAKKAKSPKKAAKKTAEGENHFLFTLY